MNIAIARAAGAALAAAIPLCAHATPPFATLTLESSYRPYALVTGDFNADGHTDLASANAPDQFGDRPYQYSIYLGRGDGSFETRQTIDADYTNVFLAGDFDGDGADELFARDPDSEADDAFALLAIDNQGDLVIERRETLSSVPPIARPRRAAAAGDINGDGMDDVALLMNDERTLNLFLGFPNGFDQALTILPSAANDDLTAVNAVDINNDGAAEILTGHEQRVSAWAWNGGIQTEILSFEADTFAHGVLPGELDGQPGVDLLIYEDDGFFDPAQNVQFVTYANVLSSPEPAEIEQKLDSSPGTYVLLIDGDQDGLDDVLAAGGAVAFEPGDVNYFPNDNGAFSYGLYNRHPHIGDSPSATVSADFNSDGRADLATANDSAGTITVLLGQGDHAFGGAVETADSAAALVLPRFLDINADGWPDLYDEFSGEVRLNEQGRFELFRGRGTHLTEFGAAWPGLLTDLDADADPDNISVNETTGVVTVDLNTDGLFTAQPTYALPKIADGSYVLDENAVGASILATYFPPRVSGEPRFLTAYVLTHLGAGDFAEIAAASPYPDSRPVLMDVNNDGLPDLQWTLRDPKTNVRSFYEWTNNGADFNIPPFPSFTDDLNETIVAQPDLNADGYPDRVVLLVEDQPGPRRFTTRLDARQPDGSFALIQHLETIAERGVNPFANPFAALVEDFNNDGLLDLALLHVSPVPEVTVSLQLYPGAPGSGYSEPIGIVTTRPEILVGLDAADVDNDGDIDLAVGSDISSSFRNASVFNSGVFYNQTNNPTSSCPADLNSDGRVGPADIALLLPLWGRDEPNLLADFDLDNDNQITARDLAVILAAWGDCD